MVCRIETVETEYDRRLADPLQACLFEQLVHRPRMTGQPRRHYGRHTQRGMGAAVVVRGEGQCQRGLQLLPLLRERVRLAREALAPLP